MTEGLCLALQITTLEADNTVGKGIVLHLGDVLTDNLDEVG